MPNRSLPILPSTKVATLLDAYPELEEPLIEAAPPFKKLKNPLLRKSVARVASLQQAAAAAGIPVLALVNRLRELAGQQQLAREDDGADAADAGYFPRQPDWFDRARIAASIDERSGDPGKMPVVAVLQAVAGLEPMDILELVTTFLPAPGIDLLKRKGLLVWSTRESSNVVKTYVAKPRNS